jgi:hypothetical protein
VFDGEWNYGDYLGYGGDYMIASQVFAYGSVETLSTSSEVPSSFNGDLNNITASVELDGNSSIISSIESHPTYNQYVSRDLLSFDILRDGAQITTVGADVYEYVDTPLTNMTEYCYTLQSNYDEGTSELSDPVCATPYPGPPASDLVATDLGGTITLDWNAAPIDPLFGDILIDYQVYKDGTNIGNTAGLDFLDDGEIIAGVIVPPKSVATRSDAGGPGYGVAHTGSDNSEVPSS